MTQTSLKNTNFWVGLGLAISWLFVVLSFYLSTWTSTD